MKFKIFSPGHQQKVVAENRMTVDLTVQWLIIQHIEYDLYFLFYSFLPFQFQVKANPGPISGGLAPIYGAAGKMPDRGMVQELLVDYMDGTC